MKLKKLFKEKFLVPTYDIDLVWHTHQLLATSYREDTNEFFGKESILAIRLTNTDILHVSKMLRNKKGTCLGLTQLFSGGSKEGASGAPLGPNFL